MPSAWLYDMQLIALIVRSPPIKRKVTGWGRTNTAYRLFIFLFLEVMLTLFSFLHVYPKLYQQFVAFLIGRYYYILSVYALIAALISLDWAYYASS